MFEDLGEQSVQALSGVPLNGGTNKSLTPRKSRFFCCLLLWGTQIPPQDEALNIVVQGELWAQGGDSYSGDRTNIL